MPDEVLRTGARALPLRSEWMWVTPAQHADVTSSAGRLRRRGEPTKPGQRPSSQATLRSALRPQARTSSAPPPPTVGRAVERADAADPSPGVAGSSRLPAGLVVRVGAGSRTANTTMPVGRSVLLWNSVHAPRGGGNRCRWSSSTRRAPCIFRPPRSPSSTSGAPAFRPRVIGDGPGPEAATAAQLWGRHERSNDPSGDVQRSRDTHGGRRALWASAPCASTRARGRSTAPGWVRSWRCALRGRRSGNGPVSDPRATGQCAPRDEPWSGQARDWRPGPGRTGLPPHGTASARAPPTSRRRPLSAQRAQAAGQEL